MIDWFDLLAVQGTLKSLLQHHNSKAPVLPCSAFFMVQLLYPYMTPGKTIASTRWTFVDKVMSLLFNMMSKLVIEWLHFHFSLSCIGEGNSNSLQCSCLEKPRDGGAWWAAVYGATQSRTRQKQLSSSKLIITFLPRNKSLLISWLQSPSAVIFEPKKIVCHCFHCFPIYLK